MEPRYLLDTNTIIYVQRRRSQQILDRFRSVQVGEAVMSVITYGELCVGAERSAVPSRNFSALDEFVRLVPVLTLPVAAARVYGTITADLRARGEMIGANDLWIAAHAKASGLILVTNNEREFRRVEGLNIENWAA